MRLHQYLSDDRGRQAALCKRIGAHAPDLSRWAKGERPVPVQHCAAIEQATDRAVMRWDLRPDDWHRIWPELIGLPDAPIVGDEHQAVCAPVPRCVEAQCVATQNTEVRDAA